MHSCVVLLYFQEQYATGSGLDRIHRKVRFPRLRRAKNFNSERGASTGPIVHEICAQNMFKARAERAQVRWCLDK